MFRHIFGLIRCAGDKSLLIFESHVGPDCRARCVISMFNPYKMDRVLKGDQEDGSYSELRACVIISVANFTSPETAFFKQNFAL